MYIKEPYISEKENLYDWVGAYSLFHWGLIPWSFYLVLAVVFGFMIHVKRTKRKKYSEACRPLLGKYVDSILGRVIDILAVFGLLAGTATTFSVATPLMSKLIENILGIDVNNTFLSVFLIIATCIVYTFSLLKGFEGIKVLAKMCIYLFILLLGYFFIMGGQAKFISEQGVRNVLLMVKDFPQMSYNLHSESAVKFTTDWTVYYWAYWIVWCIATPFFIGKISEGRSIRQIIMGGYLFGGAATFLSFSILGNYSIGIQAEGKVDFIRIFDNEGNPYDFIISVLDSIPGSGVVSGLLLILMIAFYATSFDSIAYTAATYSYRLLNDNQKPHWTIQVLWCILLIVMPVLLLFSDSSIFAVQSVSIISALPLSLVMIIIVVSFFKDMYTSRQ